MSPNSIPYQQICKAYAVARENYAAYRSECALFAGTFSRGFAEYLGGVRDAVSYEPLKGVRVGVSWPWFEDAEPDVVARCKAAVETLKAAQRDEYLGWIDDPYDQELTKRLNNPFWHEKKVDPEHLLPCLATAPTLGAAAPPAPWDAPWPSAGSVSPL